MPSAASLEFLAEAIGSCWLAPFRGAIYEYARGLNLQAGYAVRGPFDITTARHLIEPLEALRDPAVRLVSVQAAVQTLKSLIADIVVPYWIEHDPGDILWLLENDPKAREYSSSRALPLIRSMPQIHRMLESVDRNDKTKSEIQFSHCKLVIAGLNESNVQSISYRYVIIDEAWMSRATGLIRQAIYRTTQYPDTKKILVLGQGGWEDEDFDTLHKETDQRVLHWKCPFCGFAQPFELSRLRESSQGLAELAPPKDQIESGARGARPSDFKDVRAGTYSGLTWDHPPRESATGRRDFEAIRRSAHYRCYQCDGRIEDKPEVRRQLNDSYHFVRTNPNAPAHSVGFHWPAEASMRIPFGDQALKYVRAKVAAEELGYRLPLQEYYQKDRGLVWSESIAGDHRAVVHEPYDVTSSWSEEAHRPMIIDCQRDLAKFYLSVFAVSLAGECRELERRTVATFAEIADTQKQWKVRDQQVFLDCGYQMTRVLRECVKHGHVGTVLIGGKPRKLWLCWTGLKGSGAEMFVHINPRTEVKEFRIYSELKFYDVNAGKETRDRGPRAPWFEWSNLHCKDLLRARRDADPGLPKFLTLPDTLAQADPWSYYAQMRSEKREEEFRGGRKRSIWTLIKETRPNHEWDKGAMLMAFLARVGIIGEREPEPEIGGARGARPSEMET